MNLTSFRVFQFDAKLDPAEVLPALAENAIPPVEMLHDQPLVGWAAPRFLLDRDISDETCHAGSFLHLFLAKAQRKIPSSLLNAYCRMEEIAYMKEQGKNYVNRATRRQIKESVVKRVLPKMPPALSGNEVAVDLKRSLLYTDAKTDAQLDALSAAFAQAAHTALVPLDAAGAAERLFNVRADELAPVSYTPENNGDFVVNDPGLDFFTWLAWRFLSGDGSFPLPGAGAPRADIVLDGPVSLLLEAQGAFQTSLRHGTPLLSRECKTALLGGKKIASFKLLLTLGGETWTALVSAPSFTFSGLKTPPVEKDRDDAAVFVDRMRLLQEFSDAFYALYGVFLRERTDPEAWRKTLAAVAKWMPSMEVKA